MTKAIKFLGHPESLANMIRQYIGSKPHDEVAHLIKLMQSEGKVFIYEAQDPAPAIPPATPPVLDPAIPKE